MIGRFVLVSARRQGEIKAVIKWWRRLLEYPHDEEGDQENAGVVSSCQRSSPGPPPARLTPQLLIGPTRRRCGCHFSPGGTTAATAAAGCVCARCM